ncbi:MAG: MlaD family protein [Saprospiraceae bacterium]|jgi:phospholipid/cholesterol/gamma-HCH transport system substrate-binding protein|nr:MCE family protein [Saprospiraceae bacterium]MBP6237907.1 MCE family protein [Saprospiraceae bacterium]
MSIQKNNYKVRLGLFILIGVTLFLSAIFIIGKQKNMFNPVFTLTSTFYNVSGLQVGNNIRFLGINVGTVNRISIINDSSVRVEMIIKSDVKPFIKQDSKVSIGSEGIIGDKIILISQGSSNGPAITKGQELLSLEPIETDAIIASLEITAGNAEIISHELAEIMININNGQGTLGRLIQDEAIADNLSQTITNLRKSSKGLDENMEAAKSNILLRGYFNKKEKAAEKKKKDAADKIKEVAEKKIKDAEKARKAADKKKKEN